MGKRRAEPCPDWCDAAIPHRHVAAGRPGCWRELLYLALFWAAVVYVVLRLTGVLT